MTCRYTCSIYKSRPKVCSGYPWNLANQVFFECIFYDKENDKLRSQEEQLELNTQEEIEDYCIKCGRCCFFGPAPCSKLRIEQHS